MNTVSLEAAEGYSSGLESIDLHPLETHSGCVTSLLSTSFEAGRWR